jgi:hypothetical protein
MSDSAEGSQEVQFSSGSRNTYLAISLVASTVALLVSLMALRQVSVLTHQVARGLGQIQQQINK